MITLEEYDRVQELLGRKGKPRPKTHQFAFTGLIRCGECGCFYTAETKKKLIKSTGKFKEYTYYHCTRRKKERNCSQRKVVKEEYLEFQIEKELEKYTIMPEFLEWALECLNKSREGEIEDRAKTTQMQQQTLKRTQKELDELVRMRYRNLIDDGQFLNEKYLLENNIAKLKIKLKETETKSGRCLELTRKTFHYAAYARKAFITGDIQAKREIFTALGQNPTVKDGKLSIQAYEWLLPIAENYPDLEAEYLKLEPTLNPEDTNKKEALASINSKWWSWTDSNRRPLACRASALPAELQPHYAIHSNLTTSGCQEEFQFLLSDRVNVAEEFQFRQILLYAPCPVIIKT